MRPGRILALVALVAATIVVFWPVTTAGFLNWDDGEVFVGNTALGQAPGTLVAWAFSTTHMGHYQPLSWLALAWVGGAPVDPARVHLMAVTLHGLTAGLLFVVAVRLAERHPLDDAAWLPAAAAVAIFALHPLRVEPVAWASALPYLLSAAPLVAATACWLTWQRDGGNGWWWASLAGYIVSQGARVSAPLFPVVLVLLARADPRTRPQALATLGGAVAPLAVAAAVFTGAEAWARESAALADIGLDSRLASALAQPALYLWRTLVPAGLTPLDVLPRGGGAEWGHAAVGAITLAVLVLATAQLAGARVAMATWGSYVAFLAPFLGLTASGVQATADRYTYLATLPLAAALSGGLARAPAALRQLALVAAGAAAVAGADAVRGHLPWWRDSVALWNRAVDIDPDNDIALYNLALAEIAAGNAPRAEASLTRVVTLVPDHGPARRQLATLVADREQARGDAAASSGRFFEAIGAYDRALEADPDRVRTRLNRGMALARAGQWQRAAGDLETAAGGEPTDPAVAGALALAWAESGRPAAAIRLLQRAVGQHPGDVGLAMNLARLLLSSPSDAGGDADAALALATAVNDTTGGAEPAVLATLAEALERTGRRVEAGRALAAAIAAAEARGDMALAADLRRRPTNSGR